MSLHDALARRSPALGKLFEGAAKGSTTAAKKATEKATVATQNQAANDDGSGSAKDNAPPRPEKKGGVLATVGRGIAALTAAEQQLSKLVSWIPFYPMPALRVGDISLGQPHPHGHPPNVVGPGPPIPLAGCGPVLPIPYLSGAERVLHGGSKAARCGDMGLGAAPWCGGFFPFFEIMFGSASVWIEGARAARTAVDLTVHCTFSAPKPKDPAIGPFVGVTVSGDFKVLIGGVPLPSLVSMAIGGALRLAFKGVSVAFKGISSLARRAAPGAVAKLGSAKNALKKPFTALSDGLANARITVQARIMLGKNGRIAGPLAFRKQMMAHLQRIRRTQVGKRVLDDIKGSGHAVRIEHPNTSPGAQSQFQQAGDSALADSFDGMARPHPLPQNSQHGMVFTDPYGNQSQALVGPPGPGTGTRVVMDPNAGPGSANMPSDVTLFHELNHSRNNALGYNTADYTSNNPAWNQDWHNAEEFSTVQQENVYRQQRNALSPPNDQVPQRPLYNMPPQWF